MDPRASTDESECGKPYLEVIVFSDFESGLLKGSPMSSAQIALLGVIAGATIFLGLPLGRLPAAMPRLKAGLNALATGILLFLLWDVLSHAWAPIDDALGHREIGAAVANGLVLTTSLGADCWAWCGSTGIPPVTAAHPSAVRGRRRCASSAPRCGWTPRAGWRS